MQFGRHEKGLEPHRYGAKVLQPTLLVADFREMQNGVLKDPRLQHHFPIFGQWNTLANPLRFLIPSRCKQ